MAITRIEIRKKLDEIFQMAVGSTAVNIEECGEDANLVTDLGLNSVGILYVVIAIEEFFSIRFDDVGTGDFETVGNVINYIDKKVNG